MQATEAAEDLAQRVRSGDRRALAQSITLVESTRDDDRSLAADLLDRLAGDVGGAVRIGITGTPGVGKSTLIDALGTLVASGRGLKLAVLAVDPSSTTGGGSILGDKTRMAQLASNGDVFIRPSPSGGVTGGVATHTRDALLLCEAAGYDTIFVETVGVGQSETAVANLTDIFVLLVAPGGGDDLQGIKRGVMELADVVVINKADGDLQPLADQTATDYRNALHLLRPKRRDFTVDVTTCSATTGAGLEELWLALTELHRRLEESGHLAELRRRQAVTHLDEQVGALLLARAEMEPAFVTLRDSLRQAVGDNRLAVSSAAQQLAALGQPGSGPNSGAG